MNERGHSEKIIETAKKRFRGAVVLKHADRFTSAIPDIQICWLNTSSWIETKLIRKGKHYKDVLRMDQLVMGYQLGTVSGGRSWTVIYNEPVKRTEVWLPGVLSAHVWPKVVGERPVNPYEIDGLSITHGIMCMQTLLINHGCLMISGFNYELPIRLVIDAIKSKR